MSETSLFGKLDSEPKEYGWELFADKYFLEEVHTRNPRMTITTTDTEFVPPVPGEATSFEGMFFSGDTKIEITPYHMQIYGKDVSIPTQIGLIHKLMVGVADQHQIAFIAIYPKDELGGEHILQYFFTKEEGKPGHFNSDSGQGESWPKERPQVITDEMYKEFMELEMAIELKAKESLVKSLNLLS